MPAELPGGHFLSHEEQQAPVAFINAAKQPAKSGQKTSILATAAPCDIIRGLAFRKIGQHGRFLAVVKELIKRDLECAREFFERLDGRYRMAILNAGNVATEQTRALLNVTL